MSGETTETSANIPSQLAYLVPSFDPSKDDVQIYAQKVQLVLSVWPAAKISELITRLILNTSGSAFAKLQLHQSELVTNEPKNVERLIEILGGHWGRTGLEKRYTDAERAMYQCVQQADESHDSYLARADVMWTKLLTQKLKIEDLQAYVTLRGSLLTNDDKKRVILESDASLEGKLTMTKVRDSIRMLGTSFFHEMTGQGKKVMKTKVYDQVNVAVDSFDMPADSEDSVNVTGHEEWNEEDYTEALAQEGDDDAIYIMDYEAAANDEELASAFSTYTEARRKLSEKFRARGFWPLSSGKGKGRSSKGKHKSKGSGSWGRKSLQQRILESNCRICGRRGHWKSECPQRGQSASTNSATAPITFSLGTNQEAEDLMPMEFMELPEIADPNQQDSHTCESFSFVQTVFFGSDQTSKTHNYCPGDRGARDRIRAYIQGNKGNNSRVSRLVDRIESKLRKPEPECRSVVQSKVPIAEKSKVQSAQTDPCRASNAVDSTEVPVRKFHQVQRCDTSHITMEADAMFATHDTWGIIDTGATKTVIGSEHVSQFLQGLDSKVRDQVKRCSCEVTFRFGNQGTLKSKHALVVPVCGLGLKIAVVPGATPFLLSNTLLRALEAMIDTSNHQLILPKHNIQIQLQLTAKGLYLIDMNQLTSIQVKKGVVPNPAETFAQDSSEVSVKRSMPSVFQGLDSQSQHVENVLKDIDKFSDENHQAAANQVRESPEEIPQVSLAELKEEKLTFGKTHVGRTYEEIWSGYPEWIRWFYQHYKQSNKAAHRRVILYIEKKVEELENLDAQPSQGPVLPKSHAAPKMMPMQPKAKAMPVMNTAAESMAMGDPEIPWPASEDRMMVHGLSQRVLNMENALQQILHHIAPPHVPPTTTSTVAVSTPISEEWEEDPWNPWDQ
eukprot:s3593_g4.t1